MEFTTEFLQITCLWAFIYRLQKSKIESSSIFLGGVQMVAEGVQTDNCATSFPNSHDIPFLNRDASGWCCPSVQTDEL
jgi:hypothetical protein